MQSALAVAVVALAGLALWLGWRLRALQRERQAGWWQGADSPQVAARRDIAGLADASTMVNPAGPVSAVAPLAVGSKLPGADLPPDSMPAAAHRKSVLPPAAVVEEMLTRPFSVDELIDLEQQAEFFFVLGEEAAAIDLLNAHLRGTGGTCPLPYLSLLEIYRRRQDREGCERVRRRFRNRFDAEAPDIGADPQHLRDLLDYPAALATLQATWHAPLEAMAELENFLFRKRDGELFELPAYRDVLTLYAVARDRHRMADHEADIVDVLLPLRPGQDPLVSARRSMFDRLEQHGRRSGAILEDQPTAPIDLDLSERACPAENRTGGLSPVTASLQRSD
jgi:pilus assembly protein FimV